MSQAKVFDVDRLRDRVAGRIRVNEKEHDVLQIRTGDYQGIKTSDPSETIDRISAAVQKSVPTLSKDEVASLNLDQMNAIITIAGAGVAAVEQLFPPNGESPETASTSPG